MSNVRNAVQEAVSNLAVSLLKERHEAGHDIHIPSLGITIPGAVSSDGDSMSDIKIGDRVRWHVTEMIPPGLARTGEGVVSELRADGWAGVKAVRGGGWWGFRVTELTVIVPSATALVQAVAAMPQDDQEREAAISSLRLCADPFDYDLTMAAGDLGGADVGAWEYGL